MSEVRAVSEPEGDTHRLSMVEPKARLTMKKHHGFGL